MWRYEEKITSPSRRPTREVAVGDIPLGGRHPIRLQSMTTTDTMDVEGTIEQTCRLVEAGADYVRLTVPSRREAEQLAIIKKKLRNQGYQVPLVADVHFTPHVAELAARYVEKVRINPGNYADKKRFEKIEYTEQHYEAELARIAERFTPLVSLCKKEGVAMRIGTNHGSLSDRILSRYGDTALGMVESALEFVRICESLNYHDLVISMKASQVQVMLHAYRLLVMRLEEEGLGAYPLHLGVTEAGDGEDGRLKSAMGIGTLLAEGLGDTLRVSLTEAPERELPVAEALRASYALPLIPQQKPQPRTKKPRASIQEEKQHALPKAWSATTPTRRPSHEVLDYGGGQLPRVICDLSTHSISSLLSIAPQLGYRYQADIDKWLCEDQAADYLYTGAWGAEMDLPRGLRQVLDYEAWKKSSNKEGRYPLFNSFNAFKKALPFLPSPPLQDAVSPKKPSDHLMPTPAKFLCIELSALAEVDTKILDEAKVVLWLQLKSQDNFITLRNACFELAGSKTPIAFLFPAAKFKDEALLLHAATEVGGCLADGFGEGVCIQTPRLPSSRRVAFGLLQAARLRLSKTEYIACPSCGRTLFDLEETTARIRARTAHLKGLKIGIMGCIVNGPGEMADADYGYVGSGHDRITLYKGKEVQRRNIPTNQAVDALIDLIRADGKWQPPPPPPSPSSVQGVSVSPAPSLI